jgi:hypothetical protein
VLIFTSRRIGQPTKQTVNHVLGPNTPSS